VPKILAKVNLPQYSSAPPGTAVQGDMYYNTSDDKVYVHDGVNWLDMTAAGGGGSGNTVYYQTSEPSGASSGDVWIDSDDDVLSVAGLTDATNVTSSSVAASATAVKSAYDVAAAAIPKNIVTASGDMIYATGSSAVTRLAKGSNGQILALSAGIPAWMDTVDIQEFTSVGSSTWTKPAGKTVTWVWLIGGGGGGSSGGGNVSGGSGAESIQRFFKTSQLGATETVSIGAGGAGGTDATNAGSTGENSTFGSKLRATGGGRGTVSSTQFADRTIGRTLITLTANSSTGTPDGWGANANAGSSVNAVNSSGCAGGGASSTSTTGSGGNGGAGFGQTSGYGLGATYVAQATGVAGGDATEIGCGGGGGAGGTTTGGAGGKGYRGGGGGTGGRGVTTNGTGGVGGDGYCLVISW